MSGVAIVKALLHASSALTAVVPAARIMAGDLPENTAVPAISIMEVSTVEAPHIDGLAPSCLVDGRVQVTVLAANYPAQKAALALVRKACNYQRGSLAGFTVVSVRRLSNGPDFRNEEGLCMQSIDFSVIYYEPNT